MTAYERDLRRGLSAVRRVYRRADSLGEILERSLRRLYLRKTVPRKRSELQTVINQFYAYRNQVNQLEQSLAKDYVSYIEPG